MCSDQPTREQFEQTLENSFKSIGNVVGVQKMRRMFLGAKAALLGESSVPKDQRLHILLMHRNVEKRLFGQILSLPGEEDYLKFLESQVMSRAEQEGLPPHVDEPSNFGSQTESPAAVGPQALADALSKTKVNETALTIGGVILAAAIASASKIEQHFLATANKPVKFKDEHFREIVAEFVYVFLHLCDRDAFNAIPDAQNRGKFLDSVFDSVRLLGTTLPMTDDHEVPAFTETKVWIESRLRVLTHGMHLLNERQVEFSRFKLFAAEGEPQLTGTLFWEFGEHVMKICARYEHDPIIQFQAKLLAMEAYNQLIPVFGKMREPPR